MDLRFTSREPPVPFVRPTTAAFLVRAFSEYSPDAYHSKSLTTIGARSGVGLDSVRDPCCSGTQRVRRLPSFPAGPSRSSPANFFAEVVDAIGTLMPCMNFSEARESSESTTFSLPKCTSMPSSSPEAVTKAGAEVFTSALSNDGRRLAYVVRRAGSARFEIRIAHLDTAENALLDEDIPGSVQLTWSPDDSAILHQRVRHADGQPTEEAQLLRHEPGGREVEPAEIRAGSR